MNMGFTNPEQLRELFLCGGVGFLLGLYYDGFRLFRFFFRSPPAVVFAQDCLFFLTSAAAVFLFALVVTDGILRMFLFVGLAAGFFAYRYTVGRFLLRTAAVLRRQVKRAMSAIGKFAAAHAPGKKNRRKNPEKI